MKFKILPLIVLFIIIPLQSFAAAQLLLYPAKGITGGEIQLADIAKIEGDKEDVLFLSKIKVPAQYYVDGYIERREVLQLLRKNNFAYYPVLGSAVRITDPVSYRLAERQVPLKTKIVKYKIKRGENVKIVLKNKGILLELRGTVLENARIGDIISVKINKRVVQGHILADGSVEVIL